MADQNTSLLAREDRKPGWLFYLGWVIASAIGIPIAWTISWAIISQVTKAVGAQVQVLGQSHITEDFLLLYVLLPVIGLCVGLLQYLLLRGILPRMAWWIAVTVLGWSLLSVVLGAFALFAVAVPPPFLLVFVGGSIGAPQWLVLRHRVQHAALWILASVLGWGLAFLVNAGPISSQWHVLTVALLPPVATSVAWWLLLDKLPKGKGDAGGVSHIASIPLVVR